jgi:hypothetical protein
MGGILSLSVSPFGCARVRAVFTSIPKLQDIQVYQICVLGLHSPA